MAQIVCSALTVGYEGHAVLKNLSFSVERGDYWVIAGENGSGKSTLMRALLGLIQPLGGEIRFGDGLRRTGIGYLPQQTAAQRDFPASVREVVLSGCISRMGGSPFYQKEDHERARNALAALDFSGFEKRSFRALSGGQQQRVLLARALCASDQLLLLDEPVTGLDANAAASLYELTGKLCRDGITVIMISHDLTAALRYATRVLFLRDGNAFIGSPEEYLQSDFRIRVSGGRSGQ